MPAPEVVLPSPKTISVDMTGAEILTEDSPATRDSRGIYLPHHVEPVSHIAIDIGGSLAKLVYFTRSPLPPVGLSSPPSPPPHGSSSTPREQSPSYSDSPLKPNPNGALTPQVLAATFASIPSSSSPRSADRSASHQRSSKRPHSSNRRSTHLPNLPGGLLNFTRFETSEIHLCVAFIQTLIAQSAQLNRVSIAEMQRGVKIMATGGGAHKFYEMFKEELGDEVEIVKEDEMACLITGLSFITRVPNEVFWYSDELVYQVSHLSFPSTAPPTPPSAAASADHLPTPSPLASSLNGSTLPPSVNGDAPPSLSHPLAPTSSTSSSLPNGTSTSTSLPPPPSPSEPSELPRPSPNPPTYEVTFETNPQAKHQFPCLLVNIGSGVSIVKVDKDGSFERISGTSLGGGTLWGLLSLLTDAESFDEMLELSEKGDNSRVDMLVGDIYGQDYSKVGLKSSTIASSFGKVFQKGPRGDAGGGEGKKKGKAAWKQEDLARSLLYAVSNNIGQIAYMNAEKHNLDRIYFGGCFIRGHPTTISTLSYAIRFWSKGTKRAMFLRHEGFLGSIGAWITSIAADAEGSLGSSSGSAVGEGETEEEV